MRGPEGWRRKPETEHGKMSFSVIEGAGRLAQKTGNRTLEPETGHRNWKLETGNWAQDTGDRKRGRRVRRSMT